MVLLSQTTLVRHRKLNVCTGQGDRKNFLFSNTPEGVQGSAVMFSSIQAAKENGLDTYHYLVYI